MGVVIVNGKEVPLAPNERLNGIQAAERAGFEIPHYCWHAGLTVVASCRMCLVESGKVDPKTGQIQMGPKVVPACQTPATDGTVFVTESDKITAARAMVEEDLLIRHPIDCPICDKAGECSLQDYHFKHGREERRADIKPFTSRRRSLGETVTLFVDRCVMCTRCVRFTREIAGTSELMVINRGAHEEIDVFDGYPLENKMSGNVVDLCPVGALGDKDFLYSQRVWFMKSHDNACAGCSTGCSIKVEENQDRIYRLKPLENPHINQWWMCDEGRYGWKHVHSDKRLVQAEHRVNGKYGSLDWKDLAKTLEAKFKEAKASGKGRLALSLSPHLTVEEAYLAATYIRECDPEAIIGVGPIPVDGEDTRFASGFTIHAEKAPNRRGVEMIAARFQGKLLPWPDFLAQVAATSDVGAVWITGGYKTDWNTDADAEKLATCDCLIVQDCFESPLWTRATVRLPGAAFAERDGSYVNFANRLQSFRWAIRPPQGVQTEGQVFWRLGSRAGLYQAGKVLPEIAREISAFSAASNGVPEHGVDLRINQLAETQTVAAHT